MPDKHNQPNEQLIFSGSSWYSFCIKSDIIQLLCNLESCWGGAILVSHRQCVKRHAQWRQKRLPQKGRVLFRHIFQVFYKFKGKLWPDLQSNHSMIPSSTRFCTGWKNYPIDAATKGVAVTTHQVWVPADICCSCRKFTAMILCARPLGSTPQPGMLSYSGSLPCIICMSCCA